MSRPLVGAQVSERLMQEVMRLVQELTGVQLGSNQTSMVQFRLSKRMLELGIVEADEYLGYIRENVTSETRALVSLLTTHHTFFFREFSQFEHLERELPKIVAKAKAQGRNSIKIWSAACSRGQEVYSLSMFLSVHLRRIDPHMNYEILGTDVDHESVAIAKNGVYRWDELKEVPSIYLLNNWARGTGDIVDFVKAKASIKQSCRFEARNLIELPSTSLEKFDAIWVRNVFIYFKPEQIKAITTKLLLSLEPHGYLFIGLSENLNQLNLPTVTTGPSVFQHKAFVEGQQAPALKVVGPAASSSAAPAPVLGKIRVLCVDDSSTVLTLLKKIFADPAYEIVGTAMHGLEAAEKVKALNPDVVTLDIHMPQQNGVEYLEKNMHPKHPPVVMISSVSREDAGLAIRALDLGARDYVEKPSLQDLSEKTEEIRMKVKCAVENARNQTRPQSDIERAFAKSFKIERPEQKLRVVVGGLGDRERLKLMLREWIGNQPPTLLMMHGSDKLLQAFALELEKGFFHPIQLVEQVPTNMEKDAVYIVDLKKGLPGLRTMDRNVVRFMNICVLGEVSKAVGQELCDIPRSEFVIEESNSKSESYTKLKSRARFAVPGTSLAYHSTQVLSEDG